MRLKTPSAIRPLAIVLLVAGTGCQAVDVSKPGPSAAPSRPLATPQPTSPSATPLAVDLTTILVAPDTPPPGTSHDYTTEGHEAVTRPVVSGRAAEFLNLDGFTAGRFETFSGDGGIFMSLAILFDSAEHAEAAFDLYRDELLSDEGYAATMTGEVLFAEAGLCAEFDNPAFGGLHEDACLWLEGHLVLIAGGTLHRDEIILQAASMDRRARLAQ